MTLRTSERVFLDASFTLLASAQLVIFTVCIFGFTDPTLVDLQSPVDVTLHGFE
jgi:hypothetical protein